MEKITLQENRELTPEEKRIKMIRRIILLVVFIMLVTLNITEGYMKIEEHIEFARNEENPNITTILGPIMFLGAVYTFMGACVISLVMRFVNKIDLSIKRTLQCLPMYVIAFTLPATLVTHYIVGMFNIVGE